VGAGLSMGGNILLKMAGDMKKEFPLQACIVFNSPLNLWKCIELMRGTIYEKFFCREMLKHFFNKQSDQE